MPLPHRHVLARQGACGLQRYGGLDGCLHGDDKGTLHIEHEQRNLDDPVIRKRAPARCDHVIDVWIGDDVGICRGVIF